MALLAAFASWQARAASPLLPPRVVLDRNRGGAYLAVLTVGAGMFGIFLFLTYYMQQTLGYSPVVSGVAFLPLIAMVVVAANLSNVVLLPRLGPKPLVTAGMLLAAGSLVWLTRIGVHSGYASAVLGPLMVAGLGFGFTIAPSMNTGTFGVAPQDAGVASATLNTGQQIGGSIGTSLLNTIFASAVAHYLTSHLSPATLVHGHPAPSLTGMSLIHGYTTAFWVAAAIFGAGAVICGTLFRSGPHPPVPRRRAARARGDGVRASDARFDPPAVLRHRLPPLVHLHNAGRGNHRHHQRCAGSSSQLTMPGQGDVLPRAISCAPQAGSPSRKSTGHGQRRCRQRSTPKWRLSPGPQRPLRSTQRRRPRSAPAPWRSENC